MARNLPYFKFDAAEWISGEITLEDLQTQGVFINICAFYWFKSGCLTLTEIKRRVKCKDVVFENLTAANLIKVDGDHIKISFLDEQLNERGQLSKINSINGSKGGAPKGNNNAKKAEIDNRKTTEKQPESTNIEKRREEGEENKEEKKEIPLRAFEIPYVFGSQLYNTWMEWEQFRKEKKQKLTPTTAAKQIQFLGGRGDPEAIEILNQSMKNGWTGLFELKKQNNGIRGIGTATTRGARPEPSGNYEGDNARL